MKIPTVEVTMPASKDTDFKLMVKMFRKNFRKYKLNYFAPAVIIADNKINGCFFMGKIPEYDVTCLETLGFDITQGGELYEGKSPWPLIILSVLFSLPYAVPIINMIIHRKDKEYKQKRAWRL